MKTVLHIINLVCALVLGLCYLPAFVAGDMVKWISLGALVYPFALIANVLFVVLWLFVRRKNMILSLAFILMGINYFPRTISFNDEDSEYPEDLKVLTYNVQNFAHKIAADDAQLRLAQQDSVLDYIEKESPHVVCLQDYDASTSDKEGFHYQMMNRLGYSCVYAYDIKNNILHNCAIYSKYPIIKSGPVLENDSLAYSFIYADIRTKKHVVRIINIHLASYQLGEEEQSQYAMMTKGENISDTAATNNILTKIFTANALRARQMRRLIPAFTNTSKAVIVAGDFNDTPYSNAYSLIKREFKDSYVSRGSGFCGTYNGVFPSYRIDYVFYDESRFRCLNYSSPKKDFSDHYPVMVGFNIRTE